MEETGLGAVSRSERGAAVAPEQPVRSVVQLSDLHLRSDDALLPGVRPSRHLESAAKMIEEGGFRPDLLLLSGDLADEGEPECYDDLAAVMSNLERVTGAKTMYVPGNHDDRRAFRRHLLGEEPGDGPINQTLWLSGLRIVALDSNVRGCDAGHLADESLDYLHRELASPAAEGTVLVLHHPPIPSPIAAMSALRLDNPDALDAVIEGSDVRLVLCGHNHHALTGAFGSVPVWVSPATAYLANTSRTEVFERLALAAFSRIELSDRTYSISVVPVPTETRS